MGLRQLALKEGELNAGEDGGGSKETYYEPKNRQSPRATRNGFASVSDHATGANHTPTLNDVTRQTPDRRYNPGESTATTATSRTLSACSANWYSPAPKRDESANGGWKEWRFPDFENADGKRPDHKANPVTYPRLPLLSRSAML